MGEAGVVNAASAFKHLGEGKVWTCSDKIFDKVAEAGDNIYLFNADFFDFDSYYFQGYDGDTNLGWSYTTFDENGEPFETPVASFTLAKGQAVYFQPGDAVSGLTISGEVEDTTKSATIEFGSDPYYDIVNPFPKDTTLADLNTFCVPGDGVYIFDTNVFDFQFWSFNGIADGWVHTVFDENWEPYDEDPQLDFTTVVLPAGTAGIFQPADGKGRTWVVEF